MCFFETFDIGSLLHFEFQASIIMASVDLAGILGNARADPEGVGARGRVGWPGVLPTGVTKRGGAVALGRSTLGDTNQPHQKYLSDRP